MYKQIVISSKLQDCLQIWIGCLAGRVWMWIITLLSSLVSIDRPDIGYRHMYYRNTYWMFSNWAHGRWRALHWFDIVFLWSIKPSYAEKLHVIFLSFHHPPPQNSSLFNFYRFYVNILKTWSSSSWAYEDLVENCLIYKMFHLHLN